MSEGHDYYIKSRPKWRRFIGKILCFLGLHRDYFSNGGGITEFNHCVRCGAYKRMRF
jgi:hypothetical protein